MNICARVDVAKSYLKTFKRSGITNALGVTTELIVRRNMKRKFNEREDRLKKKEKSIKTEGKEERI